MRGAVVPRPPRQRRPRRTARLATLAAGVAAVVVAGTLAGQDPAAGRADRTTTVAYDCAFASGAQKVSVAFAQDYPARGTVGAAVRPGRLTATATVPAAAAAAVLPAGTARVAARAALTAAVSQNTSRAEASWPDLSAPPSPAGGGADLVLTFTGAVPPVTVTAAGTVRFAAGALALTLIPQGGTGDGSQPPATATAVPSGTGAASGTSGTSGTSVTGGPAAASLVIAPRAADGPAAGPGSAGSPGPAAGNRASGGSATAGSAATAGQLGGASPAPSAQAPSPHAPAEVTAACTPAAGQQTQLGAVQVAAAPAGPGGSTGGPAGTGTAGTATTAGPASPGTAPRPGGHGTIRLDQPPHSGVHDCEAPPKGAPDPAVIASVPRPPQATPYPGPGDPPYPPDAECGYITGFSNIGKLHGAAAINDLRHGPQPVTVVQTGIWSYFGAPDPRDNYFEIDSIADLRLPPADSAFLTFGFMPTTARMALTTLGLMTVVSVGTSAIGTVSTTTIYGRQDLRLYDVKVNGTALDVGPGCRTEQPLAIRLVGVDSSSLTGVPTRPQDYSVNGGGPLAQDDLYIPPFTGCRSRDGEDLDALFTASISGHGNSLNLIQGPLCVPVSGPDNCYPEIPFPTPPHH